MNKASHLSTISSTPYRRMFSLALSPMRSRSGEDEELLRKQCTALGLDASVSWMGRTHDVPGALRGGSVFALSSRGEGFPLALMEAMAMGVPCVAFDCAPGVHEIVRDGEDGLLAAPGNTGELARRLDRLMADKALASSLWTITTTDMAGRPDSADMAGR